MPQFPRNFDKPDWVIMIVTASVYLIFTSPRRKFSYYSLFVHEETDDQRDCGGKSAVRLRVAAHLPALNMETFTSQQNEEARILQCCDCGPVSDVGK